MLQRNHVVLLALLATLWGCTTSGEQANNTDPQEATVPALTLAPLEEEWAIDWWIPRHKEKLAARGSDPELVFLGDSITQGWESEGAEAFEASFGQWRTLNLGFSGDRTENVLWRLEHGEVDGIDPKLVVMMIGTNNTGHRMDPPEDVAAGVTEIVSELQERLPDTKILLLAIFPRGETAADEMRTNNRGINQRIRSLADGSDVFYANVNRVFMDERGRLHTDIMPDLLHPNAEGYERLADALEPMVQSLMTRGTLPAQAR